MNSNLKRAMSIAAIVFLALLGMILIAGRIPGLGPVLAAGSVSSTFGLVQCALIIAVLAGLLVWFNTRRTHR